MKTTLSALTALALIAVVPLANAESHADPVKARMELMKDQGAQARILGTIAKGEFDAAAVQAAATQLHADALAIVPAWEENVTNAESRSLPLIWEDFAGFTAEAEKLAAAAMLAMNATDSASLGAAMREIGASCQSCHETYRAPRD